MQVTNEAVPKFQRTGGRVDGVNSEKKAKKKLKKTRAETQNDPSSARRLITCILRLPDACIPTGEVPLRWARAAAASKAKYAVATTAAPVAASLLHITET